VRIKNKFEVGQVIYDKLADCQSLILSIEKDHVYLSRLERPDVRYVQVPRYLTNLS